MNDIVGCLSGVFPSNSSSTRVYGTRRGIHGLEARLLKQIHYKHKDTLKPVFLPTALPESMVLEECWNISKNVSLRTILNGIKQDLR